MNTNRIEIFVTSFAGEYFSWQQSQESIDNRNERLTENDKKTNIVSTYSLMVHVDKAENMVIIKNPTMASQPKKSDYQPKQLESDGTVDASMSEEINGFLETFFKLYPKATDKELAYYVSNNALPAINKGYVFAELVNPVYTMEDNQVTAVVTVKYLDQETKMTQSPPFTLTLQKDDNWEIIK